MNLLQIVNLVRREAGVGSSDLTGLGGLNAENARILGWVRQEYLDLQAAQDDWQFMRREFQFDTTAGQMFYTPQQAKATADGTDTGAAILADWKVDSFRISTAGSSFGDETITNFVTYEQFRNLYLYGNMRSENMKPVAFTVRPADKALGFGATPDGAYTVVGEFYRTPHELDAAETEPILPGRFHSVIAYLALKAYGIYMAAPEVIGRADSKLSTLYPQLASDQLPTMMGGAPLG